MVEEGGGTGTSRIAKMPRTFLRAFCTGIFLADWIGSSTWVMRLGVCMQSA